MTKRRKRHLLISQWGNFQNVNGSNPALSHSGDVSLGKALNPHYIIAMQVDIGWLSEDHPSVTKQMHYSLL